MERLTRRQFLVGAGATAGILLLGGKLMVKSPESLAKTSVTEPPKLFSIFGMHDTPCDGGSLNEEMAIEDLKTLKAKYVVMIDPRESLIEKALEAKLTIITRIMQAGNIFNEGQIVRTMKKLQSFMSQSIVQPFNEINNLGETNGVTRMPERHAEELIAAIQLINTFGGITLITPLDQKANTPFDNYRYLHRLTQGLVVLTSSNWLEGKIALASHAYTHLNGPELDDFDPLSGIRTNQEIVQQCLGYSVPHYVTEAGPYQNPQSPFSEEYFAQETGRILDLPLPADLDLRAICFWVLANKAQRRYFQFDNRMRGFEAAAWRGVDGPRLVYNMVANFAESISG